MKEETPPEDRRDVAVRSYDVGDDVRPGLYLLDAATVLVRFLDRNVAREEGPPLPSASLVALSSSCHVALRLFFRRFSSSLLIDKKAREQFSVEKNRNIYGGNRFRNIKKMAGTNFPIGI
jgi:hypothetical protein